MEVSVLPSSFFFFFFLFLFKKKVVGFSCILDLEAIKVTSIKVFGGCKHSKVYQKSAPVLESHDFLGQMPISSSKMLYKIYYFS